MREPSDGDARKDVASRGATCICTVNHDDDDDKTDDQQTIRNLAEKTPTNQARWVISSHNQIVALSYCQK